MHADIYAINHFIKGKFNYTNDEEWCGFSIVKIQIPAVNNDGVMIISTLWCNLFSVILCSSVILKSIK